jgi:2-dehydropantoate 2-reductase
MTPAPLDSPAARAWFARHPVLVWGAGAIGGCVAAFLARAGVPVRIVDVVDEHVRACRSTGLQIEGPVAEFTQVIEAATPAELTGEYDCILLAVKAQHTSDALEQLLPHLAPQGVVVSLQNGLSERLIAARVGEQRTIGGFVNFAADYLEPGRIAFGNRGALKLGEMRPGLTPRVESLSELLRAFDADTTAVADVWQFKWGKLAYGSLLFATALANETMSESLADPVHRPVFVALAREVIGVAALAGVQPVGFDGFEPAAFAPGASDAQAAQSLQRMAEHYRHSTKQRSGVWRDLAVRKRKTEIDSQIAEIVRVAQAHGAQAPVTQALIDLIHGVEDGTRPIARTNLLEFAHAVGALGQPA